MKNLILIFFFVLLMGSRAYTQAPTSNLYQYNYTSISPAFAGLDGQKITMMGNYFEDKSHARISSGFVGYEINADKINSGFGLTLSHQALGPQSSTYFNLLYNYQWKITDKSKLVFGAKVTDIFATVDFTQYIPVDPNDPLLNQPAQVSVTTLMFGLGLLYKTDRFFIGISTDNLGTKTIDPNQYLNIEDPEKKLVHYMAGVNFKIADWLSSEHSVYGITVDQFWRVDLNNTFTFADWIIAGVSVEKNEIVDDIIPKVNAGVKLKDKGKLMLMLYSKDYEASKRFSAQVMMQFNLH